MGGNANSGRRAQPTALKILRGNPGRRPLPLDEPILPTPDESFDIPPTELAGDAHAIAEWMRVAPILRSCGLVSHAERAALTALCQQWSRYLTAQAKVRRLGLLVTTKGVPIVNPYLAIGDKALAHCARLWGELGLTPTSRTRARRLPTAAAAAPASKWAGLL